MFERLLAYLPAILAGMGTTAMLAGVAILLGFGMSLGLYLVRSRGPRALRVMVMAYVSFFRGTPLLVQLLMAFYMPAGLGMDLNPWVAAIGVIGLNSAAFQSEILRAGFGAIPRAQLEAAQAFGFTWRQTLRHVQLPQVLRLTWPALMSESIDIIKGSAVVSVLAITELMRVGKQLTATSYRPLEVYLLVALAYLVLTLLVEALASMLARQSDRRGPA